MLHKGSITIGRIGGVPIRLHISFFLAFPFIAYAMAADFGAAVAQAGVSPQALALSPLAWGVLLAAALFACVLVHELAHVAVARRRGGSVRSVTLMLLGGVSEVERLPEGRGEAWMALVGPLTSLLLAAGAYALYLAAPAGAPDLLFGLFHLARLNLALGVFNLIPAFPLDGGRALRAVLLGRLGRVRATRIAAGIGHGLAILLGLLGFLGGQVFLLLLAFFLYSGASAEAQGEARRAALRGLKAGDYATRGVVTIEAGTSLEEAAATLLRARQATAVVTRHGRPVGLLEAAAIHRIPREEWAKLVVEQAARLDLPRVGPAEDLAAALEAMGRLDAPAVLVATSEGEVGVLTPADIARGVLLGELRHTPA